MGWRCSCNVCDFVFMSGHSHHTGYSCVMCTSCLTRFALPTESAWGPDAGELIVLHQLVREESGDRTKNGPTVKTRLEPTSEFLIAEATDEGLVHYPISEVRCPSCQSCSLALGFDDDDKCPHCESGVLRCSAVEY